jgi:hypothetical protein
VLAVAEGLVAIAGRTPYGAHRVWLAGRDGGARVAARHSAKDMGELGLYPTSDDCHLETSALKGIKLYLIGVICLTGSRQRKDDYAKAPFHHHGN